MKYFSATICIVLFFFGIGYHMDIFSFPNQVKPPKAKKIKSEILVNGVKRIDNYAWLQNKEDPEVLKYIESENKYTDVFLFDCNSERENMYRNLKEQNNIEEPMPIKNNGFYYYKKYIKDKEYPVYCRKKGNLIANEEIMIDVNELAKGYNYFSILEDYSLSVSQNNEYLAYSSDNDGKEFFTINFKNLNTGKLLRDQIKNVMAFKTYWSNDNKSLFYVKRKEDCIARRVFRHNIGDVTENDKEIYFEKDPTYYCYIQKTSSKKYLAFQCINNNYDSECYLLNADNPSDKLILFTPREKGLSYFIDHYKNYFYIQTNLNSKNYRIMRTPVDKTNKKYWEEFIKCEKNVFIESICLIKHFLVVNEKKDEITKFHIYDLDSKNDFYIDFPDKIYNASISSNQDINSNIIYIKYSSLTTQKMLYGYDLNIKELSVLSRTEIKDYDPNLYKSEKIFAISHDGKKIPISLVYKKSIKRDGNNPLILNGYGFFGINLETNFDSFNTELIKRGFIIGFAHIRGGQELGKNWHYEGSLLKKKNTFLDFIACAEFLIKEKYSKPQNMFAYGYSAGGLLMGAIANMRPDLFKGIISHEPVLDLLSFLSNPSSSLNFEEFGNLKDKESFDYISSYSPYENIGKKKYPAILGIGSLNDTRAMFWEPLKWVAKLREFTNYNCHVPALVHLNEDSGHASSSNKKNRNKDSSLIYAFIFKLLKMNK